MSAAATPAGDLLFEVCVESTPGALAAEAGGADRVELCADLLEGGITPSPGSLQLAKARLKIPAMVLVRPRGGDFVYSEEEMAIMLGDIAAVKDAGLMGVVIGCLRADGRLDLDRLHTLVEAARPMQVTHHRAFDMCVDPLQALDELCQMGVDRLLTSGQKDAAGDAIPLLRQLVERADGRLSVMPGGGLTPADIGAVVAQTGVREVHFAALHSVDSPMQFRNPGCSMGAGEVPDEYELRRTDPAMVRAFRSACDA